MADDAGALINSDDQDVITPVRSEKDCDFAVDYVYEEDPPVSLPHNEFRLTLEMRFKVFILLFVIIVVPATIVFAVCYLRDKQKQRSYERHVSMLLQESPDHSVPYRDRLSRPVPGSVSDSRKAECTRSERGSKPRAVSFADEESCHGRQSSSFMSSKRPSMVFDEPEIGEDDVFVVDCEISSQEEDLPAPISQKENAQTKANHANGTSENTGASDQGKLKKYVHRNLRFNSCDF